MNGAARAQQPATNIITLNTLNCELGRSLLTDNERVKNAKTS